MSNGIMYALLVFYMAIALAALWERNYWRALYFLGAIVISISVLGMTWKIGDPRQLDAPAADGSVAAPDGREA
jgi:drug/metabolite transporter (DMT)-like permease